MELGWFQGLPSGYTTIYSIESYLLTARHTYGLSTQQQRRSISPITNNRPHKSSSTLCR